MLLSAPSVRAKFTRLVGCVFVPLLPWGPVSAGRFFAHYGDGRDRTENIFLEQLHFSGFDCKVEGYCRSNTCRFRRVLTICAVVRQLLADVMRELLLFATAAPHLSLTTSSAAP